MTVPRFALQLGFSCMLVALASGCDKSLFETEPPPALPADPAAKAARRGNDPPVDLDGGVTVERADPPAPAGDLRDDVAHFTTLDACVAQHAVLDPLVGDAVRSIGYDTLLRDACRILQAIKVKDTAPCEAITASSLQRRCESLVAIALQDPERCPWDMASEKQRGREPLCLAASTHDLRSCGAASESVRATCEALASGDGARCGKAGAEERAACTRDMDRYRTTLTAEHEVHDTTPPRVHVEIHAATGPNDSPGRTPGQPLVQPAREPATTDFDLSPSAAGGAVVAAQAAGGATIELARDLESALHLPARIERSHLEVVVALEAGGAKVTKLSILVPRLPELACPSSHCTLTAAMPKVDAKRGGPLSVTIEGTVETTSGAYRVKVQIDSFVRDVVGRAAIYGGR